MMKNSLLLLVLIIRLPGVSQTWKPLGGYATSTLSSSWSNYNEMVMDKDGRPIVVYQELRDGATSSFQGRALRFNGKDWINLGTGTFFNSNISLPSINLDKKERLYLTYKGQKGIEVYRLNGTKWDSVGNKPILPVKTPVLLSLRIQDDSIPVVFSAFDNVVEAYEHKNDWTFTNPTPITNKNISRINTCIGKDNAAYMVVITSVVQTLHVFKRQSGANWGEMPTVPTNPKCVNGAVATDTAGIPYIVNSSIPSGNLRQLTVHRFDSTSLSWVTVGEKDFSKEASGTIFNSIAIDANNTPYVFYSTQGNFKVMKFDGNSWVNVGRPIPANTTINNESKISIKIGENNQPYILYIDGDYGHKVIMKRFNGIDWVDLQEYISNEDVIGFQFRAAKNGTLYTSYKESVNNKLVVNRWNGNSWEKLPYDFQINAIDKEFSMDVDTSGNPIIFYHQTIEQYNGESFDIMPSIGTRHTHYGVKIAVNKNNIPHIVFFDSVKTRVAIKKFNRNTSTWEEIGSTVGIIPSNINDLTSIAFDTAGNISMISGSSTIRFDGRVWQIISRVTPSHLEESDAIVGINNRNEAYLAYNRMQRGGTNNMPIPSTNKTILFKYNNNKWDSIANFSAPLFSWSSQLTLCFDDNGWPIIGTGGSGTIDTFRIKKYNGSGWEQFGDTTVTDFATASSEIIVKGATAVYASLLGQRPIVKILNAQVPTASITAAPEFPTCSGGSLTFTSSVTNGGLDASYQWRKNGDTIVGATKANYITNTLNNNDTIDVIVSSSTLGRLTDTSNAIIVSLDTSYLFTGASDSDWNKSDNWCDGKVPTDTDDIRVGSGATLIINQAMTKCNSLTIEKGGTLTLLDGRILHVTNAVRNHGEVNILNAGILKIGNQ